MIPTAFVACCQRTLRVRAVFHRAKFLNAYGYTVPVRDGREPFAWRDYLQELPSLDEDMITRGQVCAVLFTVNFYTPKQVKDGLSSKVKKAVSMNLQSIVLVDEENPFCTSSAIEDFDFSGPVGDGVEQDPAVSLEHAIKPLLVANPSTSMSQDDEDANVVA